MADEQITHADVHARIQAKVAADPELRAALARDARGTLERALSEILGHQLSIPPEVRVEVVQDTPTLVHIVLPPEPAEDGDRELTEAEMEASGGGGYLETTTWGYSCTTCKVAGWPGGSC